MSCKSYRPARTILCLLAAWLAAGCFSTVEGKVKDLEQKGIEVEKGKVLKVFRF